MTVSTLHTRADRAALRAYVAELNEGLVRYGSDEPPAVPGDAEPVLALELTTHEGHFMGRAISRLILFEDDTGAYVRDVGCWEPLPWYLAGPYAVAGRRAQAAFWGPEPVEGSMLAQIALLTGCLLYTSPSPRDRS